MCGAVIATCGAVPCLAIPFFAILHCMLGFDILHRAVGCFVLLGHPVRGSTVAMSLAAGPSQTPEVSIITLKGILQVVTCPGNAQVFGCSEEVALWKTRRRHIARAVPLVAWLLPHHMRYASVIPRRYRACRRGPHIPGWLEVAG